MKFDLTILKQYLVERSGTGVDIQEVRQLDGEATGTTALKQFGYGKPLLVSYQVGNQQENLVFHQIKRNAFGRERADDRVAAVWLDFNTFNRLPRHVPAVDLLAYTHQGQVRSLRSVDEVLLVTTYRRGKNYAEDLLRIRDEGTLQDQDFARVEALAAYLAQIHCQTHEDPWLWRRRLRDLIGHGEGIMGLTDSYPKGLSYVSNTELRALEHLANEWRWRLKPLNHRLSQVHGDFHPFNVIFEEGIEFHLLDRSRGEWGEPADDMSCMTINYIFFSLQRSDKLEGPFLSLHNLFWERYLNERKDDELVDVIQPWFAWRALVLASPIWYPTISADIRRKLILFAQHILTVEHYQYQDVNKYLLAGEKT